MLREGELDAIVLSAVQVMEPETAWGDSGSFTPRKYVNESP